MRTFRALVVFVFPVIVVIGGFTLGCGSPIPNLPTRRSPGAGSGPFIGINESAGFEDTGDADSVSHQSDIGFLSPVQYDTGGNVFSDDVVDDLMATRDELLARPETLEDFEGQANLHLWRYTTRLNKGYLTPAQDSRVVDEDGDAAETVEGGGDQLGEIAFGRDVSGGAQHRVPIGFAFGHGCGSFVIFGGGGCVLEESQRRDRCRRWRRPV